MNKKRIEQKEYQVEAINSVLSKWQEYNSLLGVSAPRSGKTIIALSCLSSSMKAGQRALFLVHRTHLVTQPLTAIETFVDFSNLLELGTGIIAERRELDRAVTIGMVQTLNQPGILDAYLNAGKVDYLIVDEAHRAVTTEFYRVIAHIRRHNPHVKILGLSATPVRKDGISLQKVFEEVGFLISVEELIEAGALVWVKYFAFDSLSDDLKINQARNSAEIVFSEWYRLAKDRLTVGFVSTVKQAEQFAEYWTQLGFPSEVISGKTSRKEEQEITQRLMSGETRVIFNAGKLIEGWDAMRVSCVLMVRSADSPVLFPQAATRGLGSYEDKEDCYIIDFRPNERRTLRTPKNPLQKTNVAVEERISYYDEPVISPEKILDDLDAHREVLMHCLISDEAEDYPIPSLVVRTIRKRRLPNSPKAANIPKEVFANIIKAGRR